MNQSNILIVLEQLIKESYFHCEWGIEWQEQQNYIELILQTHLPNDNNLSFRDELSSQSSNDEVIYITKVIFYDSRKIEGGSSNHLVSIPIDNNIGIEYGKVFAIIKYLKSLTSSIQVKWIDFLRDGDAQEFSVTWDFNQYNQIKERLIESNRYSQTPVYFPV